MSQARREPTATERSVDPEGEFPFGTADYFFYLLFQAARQRDFRLNRVLEPSGLNIARWRALTVIQRLRDCTMSELSLFAGVERTTLTRAVDQLVAQDLVVRWTPPRDRRQVNLALTDRGTETYEKAAALIMTSNLRSISPLTDQETRQGARMLQKLVRALAPDRETGEALVAYATRDSSVRQP